MVSLLILILYTSLIFITEKTCRKNRNMYAQLLLHMLRRSKLEGPFVGRPEPGPLPTMPTYMVSCQH